ncbi:MAG: FAD-dependent oxidoreductase [Cellulomonadaceae bacterium]|nr:FAD-dependent oxidoreductase [Cellulomonadaceae bacterium]
MIRLDVDGNAIEALPGQSLLEAALDAGIYIPHLCAHPDLVAAGGCKLCTVELDGATVQSCEVTVADGMVVRTKTPAVERVRTVALELILAPHPKDCTSCAAYLNCELQAIMQYTGVAHSRLREIDKETASIGASDAIVRKEMVRCIQCTRCIRACDDLRGVSVLTLNTKDGETYVGTRGDVPLAQTDCRFCSACVAVCPTGAIMDVPGLFSATSPRTQALVPCQDTCPAHTDIPLYLELAGQGRYSDSVSVFREKLTFPLSLGYVCSHACESDCKRGKLDWPLSIREVKRFAVENDAEQTWRARQTFAAATGRRVAVVGGGPAGLTAAYRLARKGHDVTVLERMPKAGGMLSYGIPRYRLPQEVVDTEVGILVQDAGFTVRTGVDVTDVVALRAEGYDAVLVATGAQAGSRPAAHTGPWPNVHDGVDLCRSWNLGDEPELGRVVTVLGGGNVAFDCARTAKKHGAEVVRVVCLEAMGAMLADPDELREALSEGIEVLTSASVTGLVAAGDGRPVTGVGIEHITGFAFTAQGLQVDRVEGSAHELATDSVVLATGQRSHLTEGFGVALRRGGFVVVQPDASTDVEGIFAAGDAVTGTQTVVAAIAAATAAAAAIDRYLGGDGQVDDSFFDREPRDPKIGVIPEFSQLTRTDCRTPQAVTAETSRCLHCELRRDVDTVKYWADPAYKTVKTVTAVTR